MTLLTILIVGTSTASASCFASTTKKDFEQAELVFLGKVTKLNHRDVPSSLDGADWMFFNDIIADFSILKSWKGIPKDKKSIQIGTASAVVNSADFKEGEKYIVFAYGPSKDGYYTTSACQNYSPYQESYTSKELDSIKQLETNKLISDIIAIIFIILLLILGFKFIKSRKKDKIRFAIGILNFIISAILTTLVVADLIR